MVNFNYTRNEQKERKIERNNSIEGDNANIYEITEKFLSSQMAK